MLLFWQTFKNMLKEKTQILIFVILVILSTLLLSVSWVVNERLTDAYRFMGQGTFNYDYLLNYNSKKKKTHNVETITPWFAFDNEYHMITDKAGETKTLPFLSLGDNYALKKINPNNIKIIISGGQVSSIEINDPTNPLKFTNNGLYNFNVDNDNFRKSLIGSFYNPNTKQFSNSDVITYFMENFVKSDISKNTINLLVAYANHVGITSDDSTNRQKIADFINPTTGNVWLKEINYSKGTPQKDLPNQTDILNEIYTKGLDGNFSMLYKTDNSQLLNSVKMYYSPTITNNSEPGFNYNINNATFTVNDFYNSKNTNADFKNNLRNGKEYGPYAFTSSYYQLVGNATNFAIQMREKYEYWDLASNVKFKVINWQQLLDYDQLKIISKYSKFDINDSTNSVYVIITPQYAKNHNLSLGDQLTIGQNTGFFVGAIGGDVANIYPTIYNTDVFPDSEIDSVVYVSPQVFRLQNNIAPDLDIEEDSTAFLSYQGSNQKLDDLERFKTYLASNYLSLNTPTNKNTPILNRDDTKLIYVRYSLLGTSIKIYCAVCITLVVIFLLILIFTLVILIKKIINQEKVENGILKANGYTGMHIASSYLVYSIFVTLVGVPLGWLIGVVLQYPIMIVFNKYFVIPSVFSFNPTPLAICFGLILIVTVSVIFFTATRQLSISPLDLLNPSKNIHPNKWIEKITSRVHFKHFNNKFRFIIMAISLKKIGWFFLTFFVASLSLTFGILIPASINKVSDDYYRNLAYENEYGYNNVVGNIPFSRYQLYDWNGPQASQDPIYPLENNSLITKYFYKSGNWLTTNDVLATNPGKYVLDINNMIVFNFMVGKGASLSIGAFYDLYQRSGQNRDIENQINTLVCTTLPMAFGKQPIIPTDPNIIDRWTYCVQHATDGMLPGKIKNMWLKNELAKKQFNFTFGTSTYNRQDEDLYTGFNSQIKNNIGLFTYGINANNKTIVFGNQSLKRQLAESVTLDINKNKDALIPMVINEVVQKKYGIKPGDIFPANVESNTLQFCYTPNTCVPVSQLDWRYEPPSGFNNNQTDPFKMDLTKLTVGSSSINRFGFSDQSGTPQDYYNLANFTLRLPKPPSGAFMTPSVSETTGKKLPGLLDTNPDSAIYPNQKVVEDDGKGYIKIHPFASRYDREINGLGDLTTGFPTNWYREAFKQGLLKIGVTKKQVFYNVIGLQESYDIPRAYINQKVANQILGYPTTTANLYPQDQKNNPLSWFNGKFSKYLNQVDQTGRYNLSSSNSAYSMIDFMNGSMGAAIGKTDYLIIKNEVIEKLAVISTILSALFVIIIIMAAIIIIYIMTESFVNSFLKFIAVMKSLGYSNWEVNSLTLGIFTPFVAIAWGVGVGIMWLIVKLGMYGFSMTSSVIIPLGFPWLIIPITFFFIVAIYAVTYWISTYKIKHMSIQEQINANEI